MSIDYTIISKDADIWVKETKGSGTPLISLILTSSKKFGQQEYIYSAKPKEIYEILEELLRKGLVEKEKYERAKSQVVELEKQPSFATWALNHNL